MKSAIVFNNGYFFLSTTNNSYIMRILPTGHLEHIYYGKYISPDSIGLNSATNPHDMWSSWNAVYSPEYPLLQMSNTMLEYSLPGKGDNRVTSADIRYKNNSQVLDMVYCNHETSNGFIHSNMPSPRSSCDSESLVITLKDKLEDIAIKLYYTVYPNDDIILRSTEIVNNTNSPIQIEKISSLLLDLPDDDWEAISLTGAWGREKTIERSKLSQGIKRNASRTGFSSCEIDPSIILVRPNTDKSKGEAIASILMYSGNHQETIEKTPFHLIRMDMGINDEGFSWPLASNESFRTPNAILSWTDAGLEQLSYTITSFAEKHVMRPYWADKERSVLYNSWETLSYNYDEIKVKSLMDEASSLGMELFVLDDGWFGHRNDNKSSLGDWIVNRNKLPSGIEGLVSYAHSKSMKFGLWIEPEMISMDSDLYRKHPDWLVQCPGRKPSSAKNQFVLDLCRKEIRAYILETICKVIDTGLDYIKWDMNRNMSDMYSPALKDQGMFFHSWIQGFYELITQISDKYPSLFIESCASGGNRIDWGMIPYSDGVWISDVTDPTERISIQEGTCLLYPRKLIGSHVTESPNLQTLRQTDLKTRFAIAAMGMLGYELDLTALSENDKSEIRSQIAFYKQTRNLLQNGQVSEMETHDANVRHFLITKGNMMIAICYQNKIIVNAGRHERLRIPVTGNDCWTISSFDSTWQTEVSGDVLRNIGILLPAKFTARMTTDSVRTMGDGYADLFIITHK